MSAVTRILSLVLFSSLLVTACSKSEDPQGGNPELGSGGGSLEDYLLFMPAAGAAGLVSVEDVPPGTYKLFEIRSVARPVDTPATVVFVHQTAALGVVSRNNDKVFSFADLSGLDLEKKVYSLAFSVQLPLSIEASASGLNFGERHWYWQRYDHEYKNHDSWHYTDTPVDLSNRSYTADIDLEESLVSRGSFENGIYVNSQKLAFEGFFIVGEAGSKAAIKIEGNGDLSIYIQYVVDPTYYATHVKINQLARLYFKKQ